MHDAAAVQAPVRFATIATAGGGLWGHATLNAPASLNALSAAMVDLLDPQLVAWAEDPRIVGVLLDGEGDKAFCAGGDVVALRDGIMATASGEVPRAPAAFFEREYRLDFRIHRYPKPVLCWAHGVVMGGGVGLMAGASHRVVTPKTRLAMPEIGIGLYPDVGGSWLLPRLPGRCGLFLGLTGATVNAADALHAGLADAMLRHEDRGAVIEAIAAADWRGGASEDRTRLGALLQGFADAAAAERPSSPLERHRSRIDPLIGDDDLATIAPRLAALADDGDPWLAQAGQAFRRGSPTSAALAFEMQRRCRDLSLADTFRLEWQASVGCCMHSDFAEGVRALLVDKDRKPRWQPATAGEVTAAWVEDHLRPHHGGIHPLADLGRD